MTEAIVFPLRAGAIGGLVALASLAAVASSSASCFPQGQQPKATTAELEASLTALLSGGDTNGASAVISSVRDLAAADPAALSFILAKLPTANDAQRSSIGTGLGQAATICQRADVAYATDIQTQLLAADKSIANQAAETAFALATGQQPIGAVGGGGGGFSAGASGGQTSPYASPTLGASAFENLGTYGTKNQPSLITFGGNGSPNSQTIIQSVSAP